jgi:retron-type reverse transcriptase
MERVVSKGSVCVQVNDDLGCFFQTKKGLRQGDPLSPILFNLVVDMLAVLIERSKNMGFFDGLVPQWMTGSQFYNMQMT